MCLNILTSWMLCGSVVLLNENIWPLCKSSTLAVTPFMFFGHKYHFVDKYLTNIFSLNLWPVSYLSQAASDGFNQKGWIAIAKLKPLVDRYSCQPMRRLDTSNNLTVGPLVCDGRETNDMCNMMKKWIMNKMWAYTLCSYRNHKCYGWAHSAVV